MPTFNASTKNFALIGKSGAGKSTVARFINKHSGAVRVSTGAICREISKLLFGDENKASTQRLDDALTSIDPSIFLKAALRSVPKDKPFCLDALRFESDLSLAREHKLVVVRVVAPDALRHARLVARGQAFDPLIDGVHRSEIELDDAVADFVINNSDDGLEIVEAAVRAMCIGSP